MAFAVLSFLRARRGSEDWTQLELSEFYRVQNALLQAGLAITVERGVSDEGHPWYVFCRTDTDEVVAHFARIDHSYVIASSAFPGVQRGTDFRALVQQLVNTNALILPRAWGQGSKILLHPAAMLAALIATAFLKAAEGGHLFQGTESDAVDDNSSVWSFRRQDVVVLSAIICASLLTDEPTNNSTDQKPKFALLDDVQVDVNSSVASSSSAHAQLQPVDQTYDSDVIGSHWIGPDLLEEASNLLPSDASQRVGVSPVDVSPIGKNIDHLLTDGNKIAANVAAPSATETNKSGHGDSDADNPMSLNGPSVNSYQPDSPVMGAMDAIPSRPPVKVGSSDLAVVAFLDNSPPSSVSSTEASRLVSAEMGASIDQHFVLLDDNQQLGATIEQALTLAGYLGGSPNDNATAGSEIAGVSKNSENAAVRLESAAVDKIINLSQIGLDNVQPSAQWSEAVFNKQDASLLERFLQATAFYQVAASGHDVVIIDTDLTHGKNADFGIRTLLMEDGSTVSIVGIIPHADILVG